MGSIPVNLPNIDDTPPCSNTATTMGLFARIKSQFHYYWVNYVPSIVWRDQIVDVQITFHEFPLGTHDAKLLWEIEDRLRKLGIGFDTGAGPDGRDWEWDWSLKGGVRVRFRGI